VFRSQGKVKLALSTLIPTPPLVRWRRIRYQLIPIVAVILCSLAAWQLWRESPRATVIGQVTAESVDLRAPGTGMLVELPDRTEPRQFDQVIAGQIVARIQHDDGRWTDLAAKSDGQIIAIQREPGQTVAAGDSILTLAPNHGRHITAYLRADHHLQIEPGTPGILHPHSDPTASVRAAVERVGPRYERIPAAQIRDRKGDERGLPILISIPPECPLRPGELVYVEWP